MAGEATAADPIAETDNQQGQTKEPAQASVFVVPKKLSRSLKKLESDLQDYLETIFQIETTRSGVQYLDSTFVEANRLKMYTVNEVSVEGEDDQADESAEQGSQHDTGPSCLEKSSGLLSGIGDTDQIPTRKTRSSAGLKNLTDQDLKSFDEMDLAKSKGSANQSNKPKSSASISKIQETIKMINQKPKLIDTKGSHSILTTKKTSVTEKRAPATKDNMLEKRPVKSSSGAGETQSQDSQEQFQASQVLLGSMSDASDQTKHKYEQHLSKTRPGSPVFEGYPAAGFSGLPGHRGISGINPGNLHRERHGQGSSKTLWGEGQRGESGGLEFFPGRMIPQPLYPIPYSYYDPHFMGAHPPAGYAYPPADLSRYPGEWNPEMFPRYGPMPYPPGYVHHMHPQMQWYHSELGSTPMNQHFADMSARHGYQPATTRNSQMELKKSRLSAETAPKATTTKKQGSFAKPPSNMRAPKVVEVARSRQASRTKSPVIDRRITETERRLSSSRNASASLSASKLPRAETPTRIATKGSLLTNPRFQSATDSKPKQTTVSMMSSVATATKTSDTPKKKGLSSLVTRLDNMRKKPVESMGPILSSTYQSPSSLTKPAITANAGRLQTVVSPTKRLDLTGGRLQGSSRDTAPGTESIFSNVLGRTPKYLAHNQLSAPRTDLYCGSRGLQSSSRGGSRSGTPQKLVVRPK